ncbi:hypothetical protein Tco_0089190 [Tanacetum coccineum]
MSGNSTHSSDSVVESLFPLLTPFGDSDHLLEETDTLLSHFDNSSPEYETFSFDIEEKSSDSTTNHSDYSLSDYETFYFDDDHIKEKSSGREFTRVLKENIFDLLTKGLTSIELSDSSLLLSDCNSSLSMEFSEIDPLVSFPSGNEEISDPLFLTDSPEIDTLTSFPFRNKNKIFNPGILISKGFHSRHSLGLTHQDSEAFKINKKFKSPMNIFPFFFFLYFGGDVSSLDVLYLHFYPP